MTRFHRIVVGCTALFLVIATSTLGQEKATLPPDHPEAYYSYKYDLQAMGTKGVLTITRGKFNITPDSAKGQPAIDALEVKGDNLDDAHMRNFLDCVKSRKHPNADVEEGHRTAVMCHLGNIATRLNRTVQWDHAAGHVTGDPEAEHMQSRPYRAPWDLA